MATTMKPSGFIALFKETIKILSQNFKKLSLIAFIYFLILSIFFLLIIFSTKSIIYDLVFKIMNIISATPGTPEFADLLAGIKEDVGIFLGFEFTFFLISLFISLFTRTAMIIVSSSSYTGKSLSIKEVISRIAKTWTRPFVTGFYVMLLGLGYTSFFFLPFLIPSLALFDHHPITCISILVVLILIMTVFGMYLSVVWMLGLVVSVLEESRGLDALGKARGLIEGMRVQGFVLNLFVNVLLLILTQLPQLMVRFFPSPVITIVFSLIQLAFVCFVSVFEVVGYTVLYVQCKKKHGEEMKMMQGSTGYRQVPVEEEIV